MTSSLAQLSATWREEAVALRDGPDYEAGKAQAREECADELDASRASLDAAYAAIEAYIEHPYNCALRCALDPRPLTIRCTAGTLGCNVDHALGCTCGLNEALADLRTRIGA